MHYILVYKTAKLMHLQYNNIKH